MAPGFNPKDIGSILQCLSFTVRVEGIDIYTSGKFTEAFLAMYAQFYTFNLAYPTIDKNPLPFHNYLQRVIFKIGDEEKLPQKVVSLIIKLATIG